LKKKEPKRSQHDHPQSGSIELFWKLTIVSLLLLTCIGFYLRSVNSSRTNLVAIYNEVAYLDLARDFKDRGSLVQVMKAYFLGEEKEDNRHPMYSMILSRFINYEAEDFAKAKLINLVVGLILILSMFSLSYLLWGVEVACLSALFLGISPTMVFLSSQAASDLLFAWLYFLSLGILMKYSEKRWACLVYGMLCGLAYLTKGNGYLLLLPPFVLGLWNYQKAFLKKPHIYMIVFAFAFISSFLIFRNILVFHNPFHNINSKVFWLDRWTDYYLLSSGPQWGQVGPVWYLSHHNLSQIIIRLFYGTLSVGVKLLLSMSIGPKSCLTASGVIMLGMALLGLVLKWRDGYRKQVVVVAGMGGFFFLLFSWYDQAVGGDIRFIFPVAVSLIPFSAIGVISLYGFICAKITKAPRPRILILISVSLIALLNIYLERSAFTVNPLGLSYYPAEWKEPSLWMREHMGNQEFLLNNDSFFSQWDCYRDKRISYPFDVPEDVLDHYVLANGIKYIVVDQSLIMSDPFKEKYRVYDEYGPTLFMGWPRCYHDTKKPSWFVIYSQEFQQKTIQPDNPSIH